jgi:hypothetical protein
MNSQRCPCCSSTSSTSLLPPSLPPLALSLLSHRNTTSSTDWIRDVYTGANHIIGHHASHHCRRHLTRGQAAVGGHHLTYVSSRGQLLGSKNKPKPPMAKYVCWHKRGVCLLGTSGSSPCTVMLRGRFKLLSLTGIILLHSHEDCRERREATRVSDLGERAGASSHPHQAWISHPGKEVEPRRCLSLAVKWFPQDMAGIPAGTAFPKEPLYYGVFIFN